MAALARGAPPAGPGFPVRLRARPAATEPRWNSRKRPQDYPFDFDRLLAETVAAVHRPDLVAHPGRSGRPRLTDLARDLAQAAHQPLEDYAHLHRVRILGKQLRYAMEIFADCFGPAFRDELYPAVEQMQEILGRANDSHVAVGRLDALRNRLQASFPAQWREFKPGFEGLVRFHKGRLPHERQLFLEWWARWEQSGGETSPGLPLEGPHLIGLVILLCRAGGADETRIFLLHDLVNHLAMHVGQAHVAAAEAKVSFLWSMPRRCSIVACRSWISTLFSTA